MIVNETLQLEQLVTDFIKNKEAFIELNSSHSSSEVNYKSLLRSTPPAVGIGEAGELYDAQMKLWEIGFELAGIRIREKDLLSQVKKYLKVLKGRTIVHGKWHFWLEDEEVKAEAK